MSAHSPTGNVALPGTIIDTLTSAVREAGLGENFYPNFNCTGNAAVLLGKRKDRIDLLVDAHLDKPTFGIARIEDGEHRKQAKLFACCANRFPSGVYQVAARALRYDETKQAVVVSGRGSVISHRSEDLESRLIFEVAEGEIGYSDLVVLDVPPHRQKAVIVGSGIDDAAGLAIVLAAGSILKAIEPLLEARSLNCLLTFSDHEEWPPDSFFAQGASRTAFSLPAPTFGSVVVDVHTAGEGYPIQLGQGISCGFISAGGRGAIVPLNYQRLTIALIATLNARQGNTAQHNTGYFSRSDDYALMRWSRILGLWGIPALDIHLGHETGHLGDVRGGVVLLSHYIPLVLGLPPTPAKRYHLYSQTSHPLLVE
jgi:hypothetical protein